MSLRALKISTVVAVLLIGSLYTIASINRERRIIDLDEAAWIFDGHPVAATYLSGALMGAIGEPVKAKEPERLWHDANLRASFDRSRVFKDLHSKLTYRQVLAGRYMAAAFAALSAVALFFLMRGVVGTAPATLLYVIFISHPVFRITSTVATADSFLLMLYILAVLIAIACMRSFPGRRVRGWGLMPLLALVIGLAFATEVWAYALILPLLACALLVPTGRAGIIRSLAALACAAILGFGLAYILDPGLHGDPLSGLISRFEWQMERVEVLRLIHAEHGLGSSFDRFCFFVGHLFFSNWTTPTILLPLFAMGLASPFFGARGEASLRMRILGVVMCVLVVATAYFVAPTAWSRYVAPCLPFVVLTAALGLDSLAAIVRGWQSIGRASRIATFAILLMTAVAGAAMRQDLGPRYCRLPRQPPPDNIMFSRIYSHSLLEPGKHRQVHEYLYRHFLERGDTDRAQREKELLEGIKKGQ